ncbi:PTS sugar transporter subunit IIC, partial [Salmonella enterica subsp. enterica serovar Anatum]|nr:PTS sugar transporter subunit IIC [Salmonella enterica subsp. enterica serovar Anatum]
MSGVGVAIKTQTNAGPYLVLGDMETGIVMGATLELAFIGSFSVGASLPPDVVTGGILGV